MFLIAFAALAGAPSEPVTRQTSVTVRIHRSSRATAETWIKTPKAQKRELITRGADGRPMLLRLIEHE